MEDLYSYKFPDCNDCDKQIDLIKEVEGKDYTQDEDGEFHHIKCYVKQFEYQCSDCQAWWGGGFEEEDEEGNPIMNCSECNGELLEAKPKVKDLQHKARYCICGHSEAVHSHWKAATESINRNTFDCYICKDTWKLDD